MKLFMKLLLAILVIALLAPFSILKDESGRPLLSLSDLKMPDIGVPDGSEIENVTEGLSGAGQPTVIYQWKDAGGNLNFTTDPPPEGVEFTIKSFDPNANVIQSVKAGTDSGSVDDGVSQGPENGEENTEDGKIGNPYTPEKIEKLFKDAKEVQQKLNERYQQQQQAIDNM